MMTHRNLLLFSLTLSFLQVSSFLLRPSTAISDMKACRWQSVCVNSRSDDVGDGGAAKIPQLPLPGSSSFYKNRSKKSQSSAKVAPRGTGFVSKKFELQYTCNICETRNCHMVSRLAYTEGVVVAICKGCNSKHLIADNLGTAGFDGDANIEEYFRTRGMEDSVNRVNREVFDLEKVLSVNTQGGSLVGDDGKPVLE